MPSLEQAMEELSPDTLQAARDAVQGHKVFRDYLDKAGLANSPHLVRAIAKDPDGSPKDWLTEGLNATAAREYETKTSDFLTGPKRKNDPAPGQSFGSFLLGK